MDKKLNVEVKIELVKRNTIEVINEEIRDPGGGNPYSGFLHQIPKTGRQNHSHSPARAHQPVPCTS